MSGWHPTNARICAHAYAVKDLPPRTLTRWRLVILQIDVEGWEYEVMRSMLNTGGHDLPSQIIAQIHFRIPAEKSKVMSYATHPV